MYVCMYLYTERKKWDGGPLIKINIQVSCVTNKNSLDILTLIYLDRYIY